MALSLPGLAVGGLIFYMVRPQGGTLLAALVGGSVALAVSSALQMKQRNPPNTKPKRHGAYGELLPQGIYKRWLTSHSIMTKL